MLVPRITADEVDRLELAPSHVFRHLDKLGLPERVYVAGAGPSLRKDLVRVPPGSYIIACNSAIGYRTGIYSMVMAFDRNAWNYPWMHLDTGKALRVMGAAVKDPRADYIFHSLRVPKAKRLVKGGIQGGATIVFCALQLLYWAGVQHATVLAAPLRGTRHFDGSVAKQKGRTIFWNQRYCASRMAQDMQNGGMRITTFEPATWGGEVLHDQDS